MVERAFGSEFMNIEQILGPGGLISKHMPGYEHRPQQIEAARAIQAALASKRHCIIEAGTGVGKSMAYLLPAIQHARTGKPVIISTHTLYLQSQLVEKDIPFLLKILPEYKPRIVLVKGRGNYVCLNNFDVELGQLTLVGDPNLDRIREWLAHTETGDVAELDFSFSGWSDICADQDTCHGNECSWFSKCFYYKMRKAALEADIIVTNHFLFFSDLAVRMSNPKFSVLPDSQIVIFDEAHHLEDVATKTFGVECASYSIPSYLNRLRRSRGIALDPKRLDAIDELNGELFGVFGRAQSQEFFLSEVYESEGKDRIEAVASSLVSMLDGLSRDLRSGWSDFVECAGG
jgi:ATP-dependent DNA helicase DinG